MAEIPIEKKSGKGWLWALLALLLIALLAWWLFDNDGDDVVEYTDEEAVAAAPVEADTAAATPATAGALAVGQTVDLDGVRVTSLLGDNAFTATINGENMIVVFNEQAAPQDSVEGRYDINQGSTVNLTGTVRSIQDSLPQDIATEVPAGTERYIFADTVEMTS